MLPELSARGYEVPPQFKGLSEYVTNVNPLYISFRFPAGVEISWNLDRMKYFFESMESEDVWDDDVFFMPFRDEEPQQRRMYKDVTCYFKPWASAKIREKFDM